MLLRWKLRKLIVSGFLLVHLAATLVWVMPRCPIRTASFDAAYKYMLPIGLWQYWGMFAPDPISYTLTMEAEVVDAQGLRHVYAFPKTEGGTLWQSIKLARHPKFAANLFIDEFQPARVAALRYAVRQLKLDTSAFPADAYLIHRGRPAPPLGHSALDTLSETQVKVIEVSHFDQATELNR